MKDNIQRLRNIISMVDQHKKHVVLAFLDAEKA